jgi:hypothetical protein
MLNAPHTVPGTSRTTDTFTDNVCRVILNAPHTAPGTSRIMDLSPDTMAFISSTGDSDGEEHVDGSGKDDMEEGENMGGGTRIVQTSNRGETETENKEKTVNWAGEKY